MTIRLYNLLAGLMCTGLAAASFYFQYVADLEPCPLCIMQRLVVIMLAAVFFVGLLCRSVSSQRIHALSTSLISALGIGLAGRQVWLQHLPEDQVPSCGPSLEYMLDKFPLQKTLQVVLRGGSDCAHADWYFLGLTMAGWMLLIFSAFAVAGIINAWRARA